MATEITIEKVYLGNEPNAVQSVTLEYKLFDEPESSYAIFASGVQVDVDGTVLDSPLPSVSGLTEATVYFIRAYNECSSPLEYFVLGVNT